MFTGIIQFDPSAIGYFVLAIGCIAILVVLAMPRTSAANLRLETLGIDADPATTESRSANLLGRQGGKSASARRRGRPPESAGGLRDRLIQAGLYSPHSQITFNAVRAIGFLVPIVVGYSLAKYGTISIRMGLAFGAIFALIGTLTPGLWLDYLKKQRQVRIRRALPDALDVISVCLQGGLSLGTALAHVARELTMAHPELAAELNIIERQIQLGRSTSDSIREMAARFDLDELRSMSSVVAQAERIGSSVASALELFGDSMRVKRHQRAEELAHQAAVKMLIPTLIFVFPAVFVVILGPAAIRIYYAWLVH